MSGYLLPNSPKYKWCSVSVLEIASDVDPNHMDILADCQYIRINFSNFTDGRIFSLARLLRLRGYSGALRAAGPMISDQYAMARRAGFDEVEIPIDLALRQPENDWLARANWQTNDYQTNLRATVNNPSKRRG